MKTLSSSAIFASVWLIDFPNSKATSGSVMMLPSAEIDPFFLGVIVLGKGFVLRDEVFDDEFGESGNLSEYFNIYFALLVSQIKLIGDVHDLRSVQTEFPTIVFNDNLTSNKIPSCEPTVSSLNDEINFRISFGESDDEDYTVVFDKNSFSYKIISTNDLKMDSENNNEKVNLPLFPSPDPTVSCIDDLDFFKDFENEFLAIVYNDALTSKLDFSTEPTLCPQHIDEFDLKDETSLSKYVKEEQNVLYFNDLLSFNIIYPYVLKSNKGNDDNNINMIQSSGDMALSPRDQRHRYLSYKGLQYTDADIADFEMRLARIYRREAHRVQVFNFGGLSNLIAEGWGTRMLIEHRDAQGQSVFTSRAWRRLFDIRGPLVHDLILEFFGTFRFGEVVLDLDTTEVLQFQLGGVRRRMSWREFILALGLHSVEEMQTAGFSLYWAESVRRIPDKGDLSTYWTGISHLRRSQAPEKVTVIDLFYLRGMDVGSVNVPYLLARYLRLFASRRKQGAMISGGQFVARLAEHFDDTCAWVPARPARQEGDAGGVVEEAPVAPGGGDVDEELP
ncbi:hypothetical protein Tco_0870612 [Tanacetum coccineum]